MSYKDHLGNEFPSVQAMADFWHIPESTLYTRLQKMPVKEAILATTEELRGTPVTDHLGNTFPSVRAMCRHWGITTQLYYGRVRNCGFSLEEALTTPVQQQPKNSVVVTDHTGQTFQSVSDMCKHWHMGRSTYNARRKNGWSVEKALTVPCTEINTTPQAWTDHLGNQFPTLNAMCDYWHITHHTFSTRMNKLGWSLEKALTSDTVIGSTEATDHKGNIFPSQADMYNYYNVREGLFKYRRRSGLSLEDALTQMPENKKLDEHLTVLRLVEKPYYSIRFNGTEDIWTYDQILDYYHQNIMNPIPQCKLQDRHLSVVSCAGFPNYNILFDGQPEIWDYWKIIRYRRDSNFGLSNMKGEQHGQGRPG